MSKKKEPKEATLTEAQIKLASRLQTVLRNFASRPDLTLNCLWDAKRNVTAWYNPNEASVSVNMKLGLKGAEPDAMNPLKAKDRYAYPELMGMLAHEAAHAQFTPTDVKAHSFDKELALSDRIVFKVYRLLEETRIEHQQIKHRPQDRHYLRASSRHILFPDLPADAGFGRWQSAIYLLLLWGRFQSGVLYEYDVSSLEPLLCQQLGDDDFFALTALQERACHLEDQNYRELAVIAQQWVEIVGRPVEKNEKTLFIALDTSTACPDPVEGNPDELGSNPPNQRHHRKNDPLESMVQAAAQQIIDSIESNVESLSSIRENQDAFTHEQDSKVQDKIKQFQQMRQHKKNAEKVFDGGNILDNKDFRKKYLSKIRKPTEEERSAAARLRVALKKAQFRDRAVTVKDSAVPPGRFNGKQGVLYAAQRAQRMPVSAKPFRAKKTKYTPNPPLIVGLLADVSGSMSWSPKLSSSFAWVLSNAMAGIEGKMAAVLFGANVIPLLAPGDVPDQVVEYSTPDGQEKFIKAWEVIDGSLELTTARGARVLVVLSDGAWSAREETVACTIIQRLLNSGAKVLWLYPAHDQSPTKRYPAGIMPVPVLDWISKKPHESQSTIQILIDVIIETLSQVND